jgi:sigma-B regulation protein RsbU (phosphoserine phosphatase)
VNELLNEVDAALSRMEAGAYGLCEVCHDPIEPERLLADPTTRFCIDHLTPKQQRALEDDMALASRIQRELLPKASQRPPGWDFSYHYAPAGVVSGDYCDIVPDARGGFFFAVGDVTGKGVAASMLMSHLHAMFRALLSVNIGLPEMMERASRVFCESTLPTHFATLVGGLAAADGTVEVCNAGHLPPLWLHHGVPVPLESTGLPIGLFCNESFVSSKIRLEPHDLLLLYTDGVVETQNAYGEDYGVGRLSSALTVHGALDCGELLAACLQDVSGFGTCADDLTVLAIRKAS